MENNFAQINQSLLAYSSKIDPRDLFPTMKSGATDFALNNPYAFCLATCLDRGSLADLIWTIPFWIHQDLGHLNPFRIQRMSIDELTALVDRLPKKPRYYNAAPRTIQEITRIVVLQYGGKAACIWEDRKAADVRRTFLSVFGVGEGIANMAVLLIEKAYQIRFSDLDRLHMDIKPDVNTRRVLFRLGVAVSDADHEAISAARSLNPTFPGELDGALWMIGKHWCKASHPQCSTCPVSPVCPKRMR